jgi:NhaA family Na+:H+ antiporter
VVRKAFRHFAALESSGGIVLFFAALFAVVLDNSPWAAHYQAYFGSPLLWINDGLMALFFLLIGLEIKREMMEGELNSLSKSLLPAIAALGGMLVPALFYVGFNYSNSHALSGWAIPTATDIAFSLAILSLLGKRIPTGLKVFLMALAIFDDIGAIIIIAIFYTHDISILLLISSGFLAGLLFLLNRMRVMNYVPYLLIGAVLWFCVLKSGVHATLAGIIVAFAIPLRNPKNPKQSPLKHWVQFLHPWVAFGVLPLFAFANAGFSFQGVSLAKIVAPLPLGIALGLLLGKPIGISGATLMASRFRLARLPREVGAFGVFGVSLVAGVGFTMSLFIAGLAFAYQESHYFAQAQLGVLAGSMLSGLTGFLVLRYIYSSR